MADLYKFIGEKIRELRQSFGSKGLSQEELAALMKTTANTISRWETATYKPSADDLHRLSSIFGVSISVFFPNMENPHLNALLSATGDLAEEDIKELVEYAKFRKARQMLKDANKRK